MTEPSDAAIVKALRRSGEPGFWTVEEIRRRADECYPAATLAHAKTLQEVDRVARELARGFGKGSVTYETLASLMLPDPPDPDEELAREVAKKETGMSPFDPRWSDAYCAALATIKRLRADGRLTDAK